MRLFTLLAPLSLIVPVAAFAADEAIERAVDGRKGYFSMLAINMGVLSGMAKGEIAYDEAAATTAASNIEALSHYQLPDLFVEGSSTDQLGKDTGAKPSIWADTDDFKAKYAALVEAAVGLPDAVKGGQGNIGPALGKLGVTCKACHDAYRQN